MKKYIFLIFGVFLLQTLSAQNLQMNGLVIINDNSPEGVRIVITKNDNKIDEQILNKKGHFDFKLALDADYKISFEKIGYITKIVHVNTEVPEEVMESNPNFPPIKLVMNLYPTVEEIDLSIFQQPVGILSYVPEIDDFDFDKEYAKKIQPKIAQAEQAIKRQLASRGAAAIELERKFASLVNKGQNSFDQQAWEEAINSWTQALTLKPNSEEVKQKITAARKESELAAARKSVELQNEKAYQLLITTADSLLQGKLYTEAKGKYTDAIQVKPKETYPVKKIQEIDLLLATLAKEKANQEKQLANQEANYQKIIASADQLYASNEFEKSITTYQQALNLKSSETYPKEMITKANLAIATLAKQKAEEAEKLRQEEERRNSLRNKYADLIAEADNAFKNENYSLARLKYTEADNLNLNELYPQKQIQEIDNIINSSKYKAKLAEYNKNKILAEKNLQQKNYAAAKVYYQKALSILSVDKESMTIQIADIDRAIEAARLAEMEKEYKANIVKADKAYQEKAFAVARFYYKKALEIKISDKYASERLQEVEKNIGERQEKGAEF